MKVYGQNAIVNYLIVELIFSIVFILVVIFFILTLGQIGKLINKNDFMK